MRLDRHDHDEIHFVFTKLEKVLRSYFREVHGRRHNCALCQRYRSVGVDVVQSVTCGVCTVQTGHLSTTGVCVLSNTCRLFWPFSGNVQHIPILNESFEHGCLQRAVTHSRFCRCHGHLNPTSAEPHVPVCALGHELLFKTDEGLKNDTMRCDVCSCVAEHVPWWQKL